MAKVDLNPLVGINRARDILPENTRRFAAQFAKAAVERSFRSLQISG